MGDAILPIANKYVVKSFWFGDKKKVGAIAPTFKEFKKKLLVFC